jgi:hypothetical protein
MERAPRTTAAIEEAIAIADELGMPEIVSRLQVIAVQLQSSAGRKKAERLRPPILAMLARNSR